MGCIHAKLSKKKRRDRKKLGLPDVKQFLKAEIDKHTKMTTKVIPIRILPIESDGFAIKTVSNTTYTIEMSSSSSDYCESPVESYNSVDHTKDSSMEHVPDYYRVNSVLCSSCSIESLELEDVVQNGIKGQPQKHQTTQRVAEEIRDNDEMSQQDVLNRPEAPYGFRSETATINASPPPYLLPGYIDELDKDLERALSDEKPKPTSFIDLEETKNAIARPKAAKGVRTPHSFDNSAIKKTSTTFSLPGCVEELEDEIDKIIEGNSASFSEIRNNVYTPHPKPTKLGHTSLINVEGTKNVTTSTKSDMQGLNDEIENLLDGKSTSLRGVGMSRPKAAKGERTVHFDFTDYDDDSSYNLPGTATPSTSRPLPVTATPSTSRPLPNRNVSLPSLPPHRSQLTVKGANSNQSKFLDTWMERQWK